MYKVGVITATRAEYGIMKPLIDLIDQNSKMQLQLIVTGTHLSPQYGLTIDQIKKDGFPITSSVEILSNDTSALGIIQTMSNAQIKIGRVLEELACDIVIVLGDRYELIPIVSSCVVLGIPVCHIHGGEITQGAMDDLFRHAITKMSMLHFPATQAYANRIIQMGENPQYVFNVGSLAVESIKNIKLLSAKELSEELAFEVNNKTIMVTFHPITSQRDSQKHQMIELLTALETLSQFNVIFTRPNADIHRDELNQLIDEFINKNSERSKAFMSLGQLKYFSVLKYCNCVVGNSSSGIIEAPSFKIPTIDIGTRQHGRIGSESILHVEAKSDSIIEAIMYANSAEFAKTVKCSCNPYERENTAESMVDIILRVLDEGIPKIKTFNDWKA